MRLAVPFVGGVQPHFAAQARYRRGKIQVINGRIFNQYGIAYRVHAGGHGPDHFLPVAGVDVLVDHNDEFCVHELTQNAPEPEHDPFGVSGVLFADGDDSQSVAAPFRGQVEVNDFRQLAFKQRYKNLIQGDTQHGRFVGGLAGVGAVVRGVAAHGDALDGEDREPVLFVVIAGMIAVRAFQGHFVRV